ncbi:hypothetical protein C8F01DRAFT_1258910 [Mycena amicta]|nr:hypothetical protein C8F01DRAFT_1258910 [Mycena amicta]
MSTDTGTLDLILSAMNALDSEGDLDRYTPSIGSSIPPSPMPVLLHTIPERPSARPSKRRKLNSEKTGRLSVARYLDTEAIEDGHASDDDDANSDDDLFIDDEPIHAHPPQVSVDVESGGGWDDDNAWQELAADYERRAALERAALEHAALVRHQSQDTVVDTGAWSLEEKMADIPPVMRLPTLLSPPMYTVRILPYWEYRLMRHVCSCPGVISSGTWGVGSGVVFVETKTVGDTGLLNAHLQKWKHAYRFHNRDLLVPRPCPISERTQLLQPPGDPHFVHPYDLGNRWVRVSAPGIYNNDLAFVEEIDGSSSTHRRLRVVPRIALLPSDDANRPPQHLLDPARFRARLPLEKLETFNQIIVWERTDRQFGARNYFQGLELLQFDEANFLQPIFQRNAVPSEEELDLFRACPSPQFDVAFIGYACALQEGDRVVEAHSSSLNTRAGFIYSIFPREVQGRSKPVRFARVLPEYDGAYRLDLGSQELESGWTVPVSDLRLHILAITRRIRVGDRVWSVLWPRRPQMSLRVCEVRHDTVEVYDTQSNSGEPVSFDLQLQHIAHDFREGDVVRVLRGKHMGQRGLVVSLLRGGGNVENEHFQLLPYNQLEPATLYSAPNPYKKDLEEDDLFLGLYTTLYADRLVPRIDEHSKRPEITIKVATNLIGFENWDFEDTQLSRTKLNKPWKNMDITTRALRQKMQDNERWLIGMMVQVTGKHDLKGQFGEIKGYSWTRPRPEKGPPDYGNIVLTVGLELHTNTDVLPFHSVVERSSGLPLHEAHVITEYGKVRPQRPHTPTGGDTVEPNETWPGHKSKLPPVPVRPRWEEDEMSGDYAAPPDIGERDGTWLLNASFVNKRIDVVVVDRVSMDAIVKSSQRMAKGVREKQLNFVDVSGHLKILTQPIRASQLSSQMIGFISSAGKPCAMPLTALLPCRKYPDGTPISLRAGRVIIIGPDILGSVARVGQYAEVVPGATRWPERVVRVKFALERNEMNIVERPEMDYHLVSLCLAKNIPYGPLVPTDFNADVP